MTESMPETSSQPGLILKTAREELSLSIEQVAQELHLRPAVVKALEEENYSEFNSDVFLKGYFRTYCRLVKLHEDRMVEILDKQLGLIKEKTESAREQELKALLSRKRRKSFVTIFVFLVCVSLIAFAYYFSTHSISSSPESASVTDSTSVERSSDPGTSLTGTENERMSASTSSTDTLMEEGIPQTALADDADNISQQGTEVIITEEFEDPVNVKPPAIQDVAPEDRGSDMSVISDNTSNSTDTDALDTNGPGSSEAATVLSTLYAVFSGDCWFKLTDGTGKTVIADLKTANDEVNYQGISPFHIVIGDASKASLSFEGEQIDLAAYSSRNGRAELNLKAKGSGSQGE